MISIVLSYLILSFLIGTNAQMNLAQGLALKQRSQRCMSSYLPRTSHTQYLQQQLAMCFDMRCGNSIIQQVMSRYPQQVPVLRRCIGY